MSRFPQRLVGDFLVLSVLCSLLFDYGFSSQGEPWWKERPCSYFCNRFKKNPSKQQRKTLASFYLKPKVYKLIYRNIPKEETKSEKSLLMNGSL